MSKTIGYARCSTEEQNLDTQLEALKKEGVDNIFTDKLSGKKLVGRKGLEDAVSLLDEGDTLVVYALDRLSRDLDQLKFTIKQVNGKGASVKFINPAMTFDGNNDAMSTFMLHMLSAMAEFFGTWQKERSLAGIEIAKAKGKYSGVGRRSTVPLETQRTIMLMCKRGEKVQTIADTTGVQRTNVYNIIKRNK